MSSSRPATTGRTTSERPRTWAPALQAAGVAYQRPYDLRHSFASLLIHEGRSVIYVARQLGHSAVLTMNTYGHVIDELEDTPRIAAEDAITAARRGEHVRYSSMKPSEPDTRDGARPAKPLRDKAIRRVGGA